MDSINTANLQIEEGKRYLSLAVSQRSDAAQRGLNYIVEKSSNLTSWDSEGISEVSRESLDVDFEKVTYKLDASLDDSEAHYMMRYRVDLSE